MCGNRREVFITIDEHLPLAARMRKTLALPDTVTH